MNTLTAEQRWFYFCILVAIVIKFSLFFYIVNVIPLAFIDGDTPVYLQGAKAIHDFLINPSHGLMHNSQALPGYPSLLALFLYGFNLSIAQIVFIQIILNFVTVFVVMKIARAINPKLEKLAGIIVLLDLPLTIYSQMIMTEAIFVTVLACVILFFHRYIVNPTYQRLLLAALLLALLLYIRPVSYFLPIFIAAFVLLSGCAGSRKQGLIHVFLILLISYGACMPWQYHNYKRFGNARMSSIGDNTIQVHSFWKDSQEKKSKYGRHMPDVIYYPFAFSRNVLELLTAPGSVSPCKSRGWTVFVKIFGYGFVAFWIPGFLVGLFKGPRDLRYWLLIMIMGYFLCVTIMATGWTVTSRFRIAMLPSIAVIAAVGWFKIVSWLPNKYT